MDPVFEQVAEATVAEPIPVARREVAAELVDRDLDDESRRTGATGVTGNSGRRSDEKDGQEVADKDDLAHFKSQPPFPFDQPCLVALLSVDTFSGLGPSMFGTR